MYNKQQPGAWLCSNENGRQNRGRLKINQPGSKIYLQDGDEFEIELFNPTTLNVKAEIKIDGKPICSGGLVIRSGERLYLECFPDSKKKFTYKTYEIEDSVESKKAISNNGKVEVFFYKEKIKQEFCRNYPWTTPIQPTFYPSPSDLNWNNFHTNVYGDTCSGTVTLDSLGSTDLFNNSSSELKFSTTSCNFSDTTSTPTSDIFKTLRGAIETGQVGGGDQSDQEFVSVDMTFETYVTESYSFHILPISQKPISKKAFKYKKIKKLKVTQTPITNKLEDLLKLTDLLENGLIDRDEFDIMKSELI